MEQKTTQINQPLRQSVEYGNRIGNMPHLFEIMDTEGNLLSLDNYLDKNKSVVVYFLATWCPYCSEDFNQLSKVYQNYQDKVDIIAIGMDLSEDEETIRQYKQKFPFLEKVYFAKGKESILREYSVIRTTTKYAIKNGKIIYSGSGPFTEEYWNITLKELSK